VRKHSKGRIYGHGGLSFMASLWEIGGGRFGLFPLYQDYCAGAAGRLVMKSRLVARFSEGLALGRGIGKPEVEFQWAKNRV
jgi:hypothetical protein